MKVICPKCQYENQADSMRVVCARCATIIDVKTDQTTGLDLNGRRSTAQLPFTASSGPGQPPANAPRDTYATRLGDEFDDVLDIPRPNPSSYQTNYDQNSVFDDVFSTSGSYEPTSGFEYPGSEPKSPTSPMGGFSSGRSRQRETQDYAGNVEPEFMGWPVLPENSIEEDEPASASPSRGGLFARILLGAVVFGALVFGAYYFLGDLISKRKDQAETLIAGGGATTGQPQPSTASGNRPAESRPVAQAQNQEKNPSVAGNQPAALPPVINPKPVENQNQSGARPVDISPIAGKGGHSETPRAETPRVDSTKAETPKVANTQKAPTASVQTPTPNKGNLTIQVASFNDQAQANERSSRLKSMGIDARVVKADIPGKGTWYRVQIGGFGSREEAGSYGNQLKAKGAVQDFIVTPVK
jgi:cell division protein FtsN